MMPCHDRLVFRFLQGAFGFPARGESALLSRTRSSSTAFGTFNTLVMPSLKLANSDVASKRSRLKGGCFSRDSGGPSVGSFERLSAMLYRLFFASQLSIRQTAYGTKIMLGQVYYYQVFSKHHTLKRIPRSYGRFAAWKRYCPDEAPKVKMAAVGDQLTTAGQGIASAVGGGFLSGERIRPVFEAGWTGRFCQLCGLLRNGCTFCKTLIRRFDPDPHLQLPLKDLSSKSVVCAKSDFVTVFPILLFSPRCRPFGLSVISKPF